MAIQSNTPIYVGNRIVGEVRAGTFHKRVKRSRHFLKRPLGIAFDVDTLEQAERAGAERVDVLDVESGRHYRTDIAYIWRAGQVFNRGFGRQIVLPLSEWNRQPPALQRSLFDALGAQKAVAAA